MAAVHQGWSAAIPAGSNERHSWLMRPDVVIEDDPDFPARWNALSARQMWALRCRSQGMSVKECADQAGVSFHTMRGLLNRGLRTLQQADKPVAGVCRVAYLLGLYDAMSKR